MYQALYRKYRPKTFLEVVGQDGVTKTLMNQIISDRLSHAYLFVGTHGTGKTSCAKIFARAVNCKNPVDGNPCNKCSSCLGIENGSILDVLELDAASNNGVDNVRALRDEAVFSPAIVKKRVYIIDEVHMLSTSAFNALLKILEEPPEHLMFILATTELHKVPLTILSRCQRHNFKRISPPDVKKRLEFVAKAENLNIEPAAIELLSRLSAGAMRDALSLLDQCCGMDYITKDAIDASLGLLSSAQSLEILRLISHHETEKLLHLFNDLWENGKAPNTILSELSALLRDLIILKIAKSGGEALLSNSFDLGSLKEISSLFTLEKLSLFMETIDNALSRLDKSANHKSMAELCLISLSEPKMGLDAKSINLRIADLEKKIEDIKIPQNTSSYYDDYDRPPLDFEAPPEEFFPEDYAFENEPREIISEKSVEKEMTEEINIPEVKAEIFEEKERSLSQEENIPEIIDEDDNENINLSSEDTREEEGKSIELDEDAGVKLLENLKSKLHISLSSFLNLATAEIENNCVNLYVPDQMKRGFLETRGLDQIKEIVFESLGKKMPVKILEPKASQIKKSSLEDLEKFSNIKFI